MTARRPICALLEWDSGFFGFKVARLDSTHLNPKILHKCIQWCKVNEIRCLYFLADSSDSQTTQIAEENSFRFVDIRVTYQVKLPTPQRADKWTNGGIIRLSRTEDIPKLHAIARVSFQETRFYHDPHFPKHLCDRLYEIWIEKSCLDPTQAVFVADRQGEPVGFIACNQINRELGQIGLIGVAPEMQGQGVGRQLIQASLDWFEQQGLESAMVVTQGRNVPAQRLYQKKGFVIQSLQLWYHRWFDK